MISRDANFSPAIISGGIKERKRVNLFAARGVGGAAAGRINKRAGCA